MIEQLYRRGLLGVADAPPVRALLTRYGLQLGVRRFVAGETLDEALPALRALEASGKRVVLDLLGEFVDTEEAASAMTDAILDTLERIDGTEVSAYMSVKPSQLGLGVSVELARRNAERVVARAAAARGHICLDMENTPFVDGTLQLLEDLHGTGHHNVSTVLQSYLYRTPDDLARLLQLAPTPPIRIVKGAYRESVAVAHQDKGEVDAAYRRLVFAGLEAGAKINVATHDERILTEVADHARRAGLGADRYEFQLLYGVKPQLQDRLVSEGHPVRIYVPYGEDWYGYFSRRLAERPANLGFVLRGLFG